MKKKRFTEGQIIAILKEHESGKSEQDICREQGVHRSTFYNWKSKYSGMQANELKRLKELEDENRKLKQMYANVSMERDALKDVLSKKW